MLAPSARAAAAHQTLQAEGHGMSAFDRLPRPYRDLCRQIARDERAPRMLGGYRGAKAFEVPISAQNRGVRFEADYRLASAKTFPNNMTRQQERASARPWKKRGRQ